MCYIFETLGYLNNPLLLALPSVHINMLELISNLLGNLVDIKSMLVGSNLSNLLRKVNKICKPFCQSVMVAVGSWFHCQKAVTSNSHFLLVGVVVALLLDHVPKLFHRHLVFILNSSTASGLWDTSRLCRRIVIGIIRFCALRRQGT